MRIANHFKRSLINSCLLTVLLGQLSEILSVYYFHFVQLVSNRTISDVVTNFATSLEEVTLIATPDKLRIKSYFEEEKGKILSRKMMHSTLFFFQLRLVLFHVLPFMAGNPFMVTSSTAYI